MSVFVQAVAIMLLPFYGHLWIVFVMMVLSNIGAGAWDSATSIWLVEMWPQHNAAMMQAGLFATGIGSIVGPLLAAPFVHGESNVTSANETLTMERRIWDLTIPLGILTVALSIGKSFLKLSLMINRRLLLLQPACVPL